MKIYTSYFSNGAKLTTIQRLGIINEIDMLHECR